MIYLIFLLSIIFHEIGHIITCRILHRDFGKVRFGILGFSNSELKLSNLKLKDKILILFSGSVFNFVLAIICVNITFKFSSILFLTNISIGILNLLPIIPLDGGNILICFLNYKYSMNKSIEIALIVSKIVLLLISFLYCIAILILKNVFLLVMIMYLWYLFLREENTFKIYFQIEKKLKIFEEI